MSCLNLSMSCSLFLSVLLILRCRFKEKRKSKETDKLLKANYMMLLLDMVSRLELGKLDERQKPEKRVNGIFWILLLNLGIYVADHVFQVVY